MLARYPHPEDWDRVRFSDEVRFGWGLQYELRIVRKPGERYCVQRIQHSDALKLKDEKHFHCWAAMGYDFELDITFYKVPGNTNGKMSLQVYIDQILEPVVKPWWLEMQDFVLEEDGDSRQGKAKNRKIVRLWKEEKSLEYFFNCSDLCPFENCCQLPKQHLKKFPHRDDHTTKALIVEWDLVSQHFINENTGLHLRDSEA